MSQHVIIESGKSSIATSCTSFLNFVQQSGVIVDKTLIIRHLLNSYKNTTVLITCHHGMGKSLNLDAVASFLSIEVDQDGNKVPIENTLSYRLFAAGEIPSEDQKTTKKLTPPLLISKEKDLIENYLGRYPVIRLDFSELRWYSYNKTMVYFKKALSRAFEAHKYMLKVFERKIAEEKNASGVQKQKSFFEDILCEQEHDEEKLAISIRFLSEVLYNHFQKRVYIFVDEYDTAINDMLLHLKSILYYRKSFTKFFQMFMPNTTTVNSYAVAVFMTGVIGIDDDPFNICKYKRIYHCKEKPFYQYYGITEKELDYLSQATNIPSSQKKEILRWYNGYRFGKNRDVYVSNTKSIAHFINSRKFDCYWTEKPIVDNFLSSVLNHPYFRDKFSDLIYNNSVKLLLNPQDELVYLEHYDRYREVMNQVVEVTTSYVPTMILVYMYISGYLEKQEEVEFFHNMYDMKIPNVQMVTVLSRKLESFYKNALECDGYNTSSYQIMQEEYPLFLFNDNTNSPTFTEALENFVKEPPKFIKDMTKDFDFRDIPFENESALRIIIGFLTFRLKYGKTGSEITIRRIYTNQRIGLIFLLKDRMTVLKVKWNDKEVPQEAKDIEKSMKNYDQNITIIKYITLSADLNKRIHFGVALKRL